MPKKRKQKSSKKDDKAVVKAVNKLPARDQVQAEEAVLSPEFIAGIIADIANSPIPEGYRAMFLYAIAKGTFNLDLYEMYLQMLKEFREGLKRRAEELQQKRDTLEAEYQETVKQLGEAAVGACGEIKAAADHIEIKTIMQIEKVSEEAAGKEVEALQEKIKNKK